MQRSDSYALKDLAKHIDATVIGDDTARIMRIAPITRAVSGDLTYLSDRAYQKFLPNTKATAVILSEDAAKDCLVTALIVKNPELAYARIAHFFSRVKNPAPGIHSTAVIANTASIDPSVSIGAHCVIGDNVTIGANTIILSGTIIEDGVIIGKNCLIHHHVTLHHYITLGDRVILHSGVVIGADGFGLAQEKGRFEKIPQLGSVRISDDVDIGANTCVDRGALDDTIIERGVKIDNLVMIAHNVVIGENTVIAGCAAISGSTHVGKNCVIGGAVNMAGHLTICDGAIFSGCAMVTGSVKEPGVYSSGTGLMPNAEWRKNAVRFKQLNDWIEKLKKT